MLLLEWERRSKSRVIVEGAAQPAAHARCRKFVEHAGFGGPCTCEIIGATLALLSDRAQIGGAFAMSESWPRSVVEGSARRADRAANVRLLGFGDGRNY